MSHIDGDREKRSGRRGRSRSLRFRPGWLELERRRLLASYTVNSTADGIINGVETLRAAVLAADSNSGSNTITFASNITAGGQTIALTEGELAVTAGNNLTIQGPGAGLLTVSGSLDDRLFQVDSGATLTISGLTLTGGSQTGSGGAVDDQGTATLSDCTISGNTAKNGGALYASSGGKLTLNGCTVGDNSASYGGGAWNRGTLTMTGCTVVGNSAYNGGGLLNYKYGHANLTDCTISGNSAELGGGLSNYGASTLTACTISGNTASNTPSNRASNPGGGIYNFSRYYGGKTTIVDTIVAGNLTVQSEVSDIGGDNAASVVGSYDLIGVGGHGGIISGLSHDTVLTTLANLGLAPLGDYGGPTPTMALIPGGAAIGKGLSQSGVTTDQRGFALDSPVDIGSDQAVAVPLAVAVATDVDGAPSGEMDLRGAVDLADIGTSAATITFAGSAFNTAQTITLTGGSLPITGTGGTIAIDGPATGLAISGGGVSGVFRVGLGASATITGLSIVGGSSASGGGLYNLGSATLTDCAITGNTASGNGGGVANLGVLDLLQCTLGGDSAGGGGGGVFNSGQATLTACTVSGNTAAGGGGGLDEGHSGSDAATLGDSIVAGNAGVGGSAGDIAGADAANVTGTDDLIGTGGSGGIVGGAGGDIVLSSLAGLGLAPLGNDGGTTSTFALLPGCPAIDAGSSSLIPGGISTDQRGEPRVVGAAIDIGAVECQGFTLTAAAGSTPQSASLGAAFGSPLAATVAAKDAAEPVAGGIVTFTVNPAGGASATLSAASATIGAGGTVQVTATANLVAGRYGVTASAAGAAAVGFVLNNLGSSLFSGLSSPTIAFGTATVTLSGTITDGSLIPVGEDVAVTVNGDTQQAVVQSGGSFSSTFNTSAFLVAGSPYTISYAYTSDGTIPSSAATGTLTVTKASPTILVVDAGGTYSGSTFPATATIAGVSGSPSSTLETVGLTLSYYAGSSPTGTPLSGAPSVAGTYTVQASFAGSADYTSQTGQATFIIAQATPTITWGTPASIVYGTALGSSQLDASASVPGSFSYTPAAGTVPHAGTLTLSATFTPADSADYTTATATVQLVVSKATPTITWSTPAPIVYGTALGSSQLDASASTSGTFAYSPATGTVLGAGTQTLTATFTPSDTTDYTTAAATTTIVVNRATPTITWGTPAPIVYGTPLGPVQLDASTTVQGTFVYSPAAGAVLGAGTKTLSVSFTPSDSADYMTATATTTLVIAQATPSITWTTPAPIVYGTALGSSQLDASANVGGTFSYSPAAGTVPSAGTQTLTATFTPTDSTDYATTTATATIVVNKATPTITWNPATPITYGTPLGSSQLDATASTSGTFTYSPSAGTVLGAGTQTLSATFTPSDSADYATATATTSITVAKATPTIMWTTPAPIVYGTALGSSQLDASASTSGTLAYSPATGTVLGAGTQTLTATFTPSDPADYTTATATTTLIVNKATPTITWGAPSPIVYGTALGPSQLDATSPVTGTFVYSPAAGVVLGAGTQTLTATLTPSDSADDTMATATTTIVVNRATPTITWGAPASITYGTALGPSQLDASASVPGTFTYSPAAGTILAAGTQTLTATFTPTDSTDDTTATATTSISVAKATPTITWGTPTGITYGTALGSSQLDASASVPGTFSYTPAAGTILAAGTQTISALFTPTDAADDNTAEASTTIVVSKASPTVQVSDGGGVYDVGPFPATATVEGLNGTPESSLEGTSPTLTYYEGGAASGTPMSGVPLAAGTYTVLASFPGSTDYRPGSATDTFTITPATPAIDWPTPPSMVYGTPLGDGQLDATSSVPGTYSYSPQAGQILSVGQQTLTVTLIPSDSKDYTTATSTVTLVVAPYAPVITWPSPSPIVYGTALGSSQLDATANVPGSFNYNPAAGKVLPAGNQTLTVTFTPDDSTDYGTVTATITIVVEKATPTITWGAPSSIVYGTALGSTQLDATASTSGSYSYSPAAGTILHAGTQTLTVTFAPTDSSDWNAAAATTTIVVSPAVPVINWADPAAIVYGTALGPSQLDASAGVPGTFSYSPAAGTIPGAGVQTLTLIFTPSDSVDFSTTTATAAITVMRATPTIQVTDGGGTFDGSPFAATAVITGADGASGPGLEGVDPVVTYYAGTTSTGPSFVGAPTAAGTYTAVASFPGSPDYATAASPPVTFTIAPAPSAVTLTTSAGSAVFGQAVTLTATVSGAGVPTGTVTFLDGGVPLGTAAVAANGQAVLTVNTLGLGGHSLTAVYAGDADRSGSQSGTVAESISPARAQIVLVPHAVLKRKKVVSLSLTAEIEPVAPGGGVPSGVVTFKVKKKKTLGTASVVGGQATITLKPAAVLNKPITVIYGGTADFQAASIAVPRFTTQAARAAARPALSRKPRA